MIHLDEAQKEKFIPVIEKYRNINSETGCWNWTGCIGKNGYGQTRFFQRTKIYTHRLSYLLFIGDLPRGSKMQIDHLCKNRACFNPSHLELVTAAENNRRITDVCKRGHSLLDENNIYRKDGKRICKTCRLMLNREHYQRLYSKAANDGHCVYTKEQRAARYDCSV